MYSTELGINFFGNESNKKRQLNKIEILKKNINNLKSCFLLLLQIIHSFCSEMISSLL